MPELNIASCDWNAYITLLRQQDALWARHRDNISLSSYLRRQQKHLQLLQIQLARCASLLSVLAPQAIILLNLAQNARLVVLVDASLQPLQERRVLFLALLALEHLAAHVL